jgi:hypothetical protein
MRVAGIIVSGLGILLFMIGNAYWTCFFMGTIRRRVELSRLPWALLGNLTVVGQLVFAAGQTLMHL